MSRTQLAAEWPSRLAAISWERFATAYGPARNTARQLLDLVSADPEAALDATHELWCALCHQHAYVSSAALPALPFLLEALRLDDDRLKVEILDILTGFAKLTAPPSATGPGTDDGAWTIELRNRLIAERASFEALTASGNEEVADLAARIVAEL